MYITTSVCYVQKRFYSLNAVQYELLKEANLTKPTYTKRIEIHRALRVRSIHHLYFPLQFIVIWFDGSDHASWPLISPKQQLEEYAVFFLSEEKDGNKNQFVQNIGASLNGSVMVTSAVKLLNTLQIGIRKKKLCAH